MDADHAGEKENGYSITGYFIGRMTSGLEITEKKLLWQLPQQSEAEYIDPSNAWQQVFIHGRCMMYTLGYEEAIISLFEDNREGVKVPHSGQYHPRTKRSTSSSITVASS